MIALDGDSNRIGDVTVLADEGVMALLVDGRWPGMAAITPDQADGIAELLRVKAREARKQKAPAK